MEPEPFHFLLVEDNRAHAKLVSLALQEHVGRCTVDHVCDGEEALRYLRQEQPYRDRRLPDTILLDLKLPRIDGHEVLRKIKEDHELQLIPVVVLTTSDTVADKTAALRHHANSYVMKPIDGGSFHAVVKAISDYWTRVNRRPLP